MVNVKTFPVYSFVNQPNGNLRKATPELTDAAFSLNGVLNYFIIPTCVNAYA